MTPTATRTRGAATAVLTGLALGDALGSPTEFLDVPAVLAETGPWREMELPAPALVTDDTQMALALGDALRATLDHGPLEPDRFALEAGDAFVRWYHDPDNNRAPGGTCLAACAALDALDRPREPWQRASRTGSKGCGANMRVAPVALVPGTTAEQRAGAAQAQAALTHGHPTALAASDLTAHAVHLLAGGADPAGLVGRLRSYALDRRTRYHHAWLGDLWSLAGDPTPDAYTARGFDECLAALDRLRAALAHPSPETDPCLATGDGWIAEEALATALHCFLLFPRDPLTALRRAACTRGDSDSIACLTGAFAGAHLGPAAWPADWSGRVEYRARLLELGRRWDA
ncbi:ADP-ribosylglycohydrolase family protein [Streptomyces sp. NPDC047002]|uniref:ADP-ribosylglycohydrolase family protein n=1 Tax=Streptomyces sp. NPDC047002 TaxID=3155475 RepID=UPI0034553ED8